MRVASATRLRLFCSFLAVVFLAAIPAAAQTTTPPFWNSGAPNNVNNTALGSAIKPVTWPLTAQWVPYSWGTTYPDSTITEKHPVRDQRVQDPSNGGTTPQNYVNVSSGCPDQTLPSTYYYFDTVNKVSSSAGAWSRSPTTTPPDRAPAHTRTPAPGTPRSGPSSSISTATATATSPCTSTAPAAGRRHRSTSSARSGARRPATPSTT